MRRVLGLLAALVLVTGCGWTQFAADARHSRTNPQETRLGLGDLPSLVTAWDSPVGIRTEPAVRGGRVIAAGRHTLYSLDAVTGAVNWSLADSGQPGDRFAPPTTHGGDLDGVVDATDAWSWVTRSDGEASGVSRAVDATTGVVTATDAGVDMPPLHEGAWTYAIHHTERLCCQPVLYVEATNGADRFAVPVRAFDLVTDGTTVFARAQYGTDALAVFPATGCGAPTCTPAIWRPAAAQGLDDALALGDHSAFVAGGLGLLAFPRGGCGAATCAETWHATGGGITGIAIAGSTVLVTRGAVLEAYAEGGCGTTLCAPLWTSTAAGTLTAPTVANGVVYAGSDDATLRGWPLAGCGTATCPVAWSAAQGGAVGPVVVSTGSLFFTVGVDDFSDGVLRKLALPAD